VIPIRKRPSPIRAPPTPIEAAIAAYSRPVGPEAKLVFDRLSALSPTEDKFTFTAFKKIDALWPKPSSLSADDSFLAELEAASEKEWGRDDRPSEFEPNSLIGALVEGAKFAARLVGEMEREEKRVLPTSERAARALEVLRGFVRAIERERKSPWTDTPLDRPDITFPGELEKVHDGLHILDQWIETRAEMAAKSRVAERFGVSRKAGAIGSDMEGARLAAKRIRAATPTATLKEIAAVLNCAFKPTKAINDGMLKDLTGKKRDRWRSARTYNPWTLTWEKKTKAKAKAKGARPTPRQ
jgi:hypothetical protein